MLQKSVSSRPAITSAFAMAAPAAFRLIQRMARGEIHAAVAVDDRRLQKFGEFDHAREAGGSARDAIGDQHRILRGDEQPRDFGDGAGIADRRRRHRQLRNA